MTILAFYCHSLIILTVFGLFLLFLVFFVIGWSGGAYLAIFRPYLEKFEKKFDFSGPDIWPNLKKWRFFYSFI